MTPELINSVTSSIVIKREEPRSSSLEFIILNSSSSVAVGISSLLLPVPFPEFDVPPPLRVQDLIRRSFQGHEVLHVGL